MKRVKFVILMLAFVFVASAGATTGIRLVELKPTDIAVIKKNRLNCSVSKTSFLCTESGRYPRLTFYSTTVGGDTGNGKFFIFRTQWKGADMEIKSQESRRD
jgi:hypothetical protein